MVFYCGKAAEAFFVHVDSEWVYATHIDIYPEVKLELIYQKRLMQVPLNHKVIIRVQIINISRHKNASPLTRRFRLDNKSFAFIFA